MVEGAKNGELIEVCKRTEMMLVEERSMREAGERAAQGRLDEISQNYNRMQKSLLAMQQQLQTIANQMQLMNRGKSVLGEPHVMGNAMRGSTSQLGNTRSNMGIMEQTRVFGASNPIPKLESPKFDDNPRVWWRKHNKLDQLVDDISVKKPAEMEVDEVASNVFAEISVKKNRGIKNRAEIEVNEVSSKVLGEMSVKKNRGIKNGAIKRFDKMAMIELNELKGIGSGNKIEAVFGSFLDNERMALTNLLNTTTTYGNEKIDNKIEQIPEVYFPAQVKLCFHYGCDDIVNFIIDPGGTIMYNWNWIMLIYNSRRRYMNCGIIDYLFKGGLQIDLWMKALDTIWIYVIFSDHLIILLLMRIIWKLYFGILSYYVTDMVSNQFHVKNAIVICSFLLKSLKEISKLTDIMGSFALNVFKLQLLQIKWFGATEYIMKNHVIWLVPTSQASDLRIWFELEKEVKDVTVSKRLKTYSIEIVCVSFLILFTINYFTGKRVNENLALAWATKFATKDSIFYKNFNLLGVGEADDSPLLLKEGQNVFFYMSGRRFCSGLLATMELKNRRDLISRLYNMLVRCKDEITIEVYMNGDAMDQVVCWYILVYAYLHQVFHCFIGVMRSTVLLIKLEHSLQTYLDIQITKLTNDFDDMIYEHIALGRNYGLVLTQEVSAQLIKKFQERYAEIYKSLDNIILDEVGVWRKKFSTKMLALLSLMAQLQWGQSHMNLKYAETEILKTQPLEFSTSGIMCRGEEKYNEHYYVNYQEQTKVRLFQHAWSTNGFQSEKEGGFGSGLVQETTQGTSAKPQLVQFDPWGQGSENRGSNVMNRMVAAGSNGSRRMKEVDDLIRAVEIKKMTRKVKRNDTVPDVQLKREKDTWQKMIGPEMKGNEWSKNTTKNITEEEKLSSQLQQHMADMPLALKSGPLYEYNSDVKDAMHRIEMDMFCVMEGRVLKTVKEIIQILTPVQALEYIIISAKKLSWAIEREREHGRVLNF